MASEPKSAPALTLSDEMLDRAWEAYLTWGDNGFSGTIEDGQRSFARTVIEAAFEGVPLANYGVGLALASDGVDMVALVKTSAAPGAMLLAADPAEPDAGLVSLDCKVGLQFGGADLQLRSLTFSKIEAPR